MNTEEARKLLGVEANASEVEIEKAYHDGLEDVRRRFVRARMPVRVELNQMLESLAEARTCLIDDIHRRLRVGQKIAGRFKLTRDLSREGTRLVWLAHDGQRMSPVVLKFLPDEFSQDQEVVEELKRKTLSWSQLNHPNIANIYELVESENGTAISMEYVDGSTLLELRLAKANQVFEASHLQVWLEDLCNLLESDPLRHELKAENLRVDRANHLKLAEFGLTRLVKRLTRQPRSAGGGLVEAGPEQTPAGTSKAETNIHTLGELLYELLTGSSPYSAGAGESREEIVPSMTVRRAKRGVIGEAIPENWEKTVAACLTKDPARRPRSAKEVREMLTSVWELPPPLPEPDEIIELDEAIEPDEIIEPDETIPLHWQYVFTKRVGNGRIETEEEQSAIAAEFLSPRVLVAVRGGEASQAPEQVRNLMLTRSGPQRGHGFRFPERGQRFLTFGVQRLSIDDAEIHDHLTYRFARQAALQLRFNHWDDSQGFRSEPLSFDFRAQVSEKARLERWFLSDEHLQLFRGILPEETTDPSLRPILEDWMQVMPRLATLVERSTKQADWLNQLEKLASQRYEKTFRGMGVASFYGLKAGSRREYTQAIRARIEQELIGEWQAGTQSMHEAPRMLEALTAYLKEKSGDFATRIATHKEHAERDKGLVRANHEGFAHIGILGVLLGRRKSLLNTHMEHVRNMYMHRSLVDASEFGRLLLQNVIAEMVQLRSDVESAAARIDDSAAAFEKSIAERCTGRFYHAAHAHEFGWHLDRNNREQARHARAIRDAVAAQAVAQGGSDTAFSRMSQIKREDYCDLMERECAASARAVHDAVAAKGRSVDPLLGENIIGQLQREFSGRPDDWRHFSHDLLTHTEKFLAIGDQENARTLSQTKLRRCVIILPKAPQHASFCEEVKNSISQRLSRKLPVKFVENEESSNEITFLTTKQPLSAD